MKDNIVLTLKKKALPHFEIPGICLPTDTALTSQNTLILYVRNRLFVKLSYLVVRTGKEKLKNLRLFLVHDVAGIVHSVQELGYGLGHEIFCLLQEVQPGSGAHPAFYCGYRGWVSAVKRRNTILTSHPNMASRLRISGAIYLLCRPG